MHSSRPMTGREVFRNRIARYAGATIAQELARSFALQWHQDGLTHYIVFARKSNTPVFDLS